MYVLVPFPFTHKGNFSIVLPRKSELSIYIYQLNQPAALEAEINLFLNQYKEITDDKGCQRAVRNGYLPEREIQTEIGQVPVRMPRIRDRQPAYKEY